MAIYDAPESLHVGTGTETVFGFNWPYLLPRDLRVTVNGVEVAAVLASTNQVTIVPAPAALAIVRIFRNTPAQNPTYLFATGIPMLPKYIDGNNKQLLYALQEGLLQFAHTQATAEESLRRTAAAEDAAANAAASAAQQARDMRRTVRVPVSDPEIRALPPATTRANKIMGFDAAGQPIGVLPASGSGTELAIDLANMTDPYKGSSLVGYVSTWPGAEGLPVSQKFLGLCLCPEEFGAKGDGVTDDSAAFYAMSQAKGNIRLRPGSNYLLTQEFAVENRVLDMNGSKITFYLTGATQRAVRLMDGSEIRNGFVELTTTHDVDVFGDALIPIIVGQYYEGVGYQNVGIFNMVVLNNRKGGVGVFITGDTSNVVVDRLFCPETDTGAAGIYAEWGGTVGVNTYHPHNMHWSNIVIGKRSVVIGGPDGLLLGTSGCYNVLIENFVVEAGPGCNLHPIGIKVGGGAGFAFAADPSIRDMVSPNVVLRSGKVINNGTRPNAWLYGRSSVGARSWRSGGVRFENIQMVGNSAVNGTLTEYTAGGKFVDVVLSKNLQGHAFGPGVRDIQYVGGSVFECWQHGFNVGNTASPPRDIKILGVETYRNGQRSLTELDTYWSGIFLNNSEGIVVKDCVGGLVEGVETQYTHINAGGLSAGRVKNAKVYDNNTRALRNLRPEDTPAAYIWGANASDYAPAYPDGRFTNNTCDVAVTAQRYAGMRPCIMYQEEAPISSSTSTKVPRSIGPANPTAGSWARGSTMTYTPGAITVPGGKLGSICTTAGDAGSTAVFKNYGAIDS
ncbi:tail protein [Pseudomonas phage phiNV3]|uniref:Putative tail protein n=1 Tax=Pseudomonas phage phiNV3 TaxID=2079544 RepID=A0A2P0ZLK8_9CAUD|nr:tail protein [Pseudomonas phage phiNV3]AVH86148.1 putative tail protein [Pseudomonas phage phiNV3]